MKNIKTKIAAVLFTFTFSLLPSLAQDKTSTIDTLSFKVSGVCGSCKARIENAALIKGVKQAEWNKDAQMLTVVFNTTKATEENIQKAVADAGHDTEKVIASDEAYNKLPKCCTYRDGVEAH